MSEIPELSIAVPARDEEPNLAALVDEVRRSVVETGVDAELVIVDDGSRDGTPARLAELARLHPWLHAYRLEEPLGQSAALALAIAMARGRFIGMLDADLQNDPADLVPLLALVRRGDAELAQGVRVVRHDTAGRKLASAIGWAARRLILGDLTRDTGCTTRVLTESLARRLPLHLRGLHRFVPVYARGIGARVTEIPVDIARGAPASRSTGTSRAAPRASSTVWA